MSVRKIGKPVVVAVTGFPGSKATVVSRVTYVRRESPARDSAQTAGRANSDNNSAA
jgi:hypothetical protein